MKYVSIPYLRQENTVYAFDENGRHIFKACVYTDPYKRHQEEVAGTARLFQIAPEMYEYLERRLKYLKESLDPCWGNDLREAREIEGILNKARGEEK